jgi:GMP synthase (glutamine-hydrolysing)
MRVLLVDNTKADKCDFTLKLEALLETMVEIVRFEDTTDDFDAAILSGSSLNLSEPNRMEWYHKSINVLLRMGSRPVLGICFGMQLICSAYGGKVGRLQSKEQCQPSIDVRAGSVLLNGEACSMRVTLSHQDYVSVVPPGFVSYSRRGEHIQIVESLEFMRFGVQFHPECAAPLETRCVLRNFLAFAARRVTRDGSGSRCR